MPARKRKPSNLLKYLIIAGILAAAGFGVYSVQQFQHSEENIQGFIACDKEGKVCELSQHVHADIELNICGKDIEFEKEKGRTDQAHTHKEKNKIHWHAPIKVNPQSKIPLDPKPLSISSFLNQMEVSIPDKCPDNPAPELKVTVNGQGLPSKLDYIWSDGDRIKVDLK